MMNIDLEVDNLLKCFILQKKDREVSCLELYSDNFRNI